MRGSIGTRVLQFFVSPPSPVELVQCGEWLNWAVPSSFHVDEQVVYFNKG